MYLLSWNRLEGDITVISIPRDTMTQIETFDPGGKSLGKSKKIISVYLMHTVTADMKAVSWRKMQFRIALRTADRRYCALNMDGLPVLTDSVGGVTVTVPNDSLAEVDPGYAKSEWSL